MDIEKRDFLEELVYTGFEPRDEEPKPSDEERTFRRYTQDSPVMPDVWMHFGLEPYRRHDLLLTPILDRSPGKLANLLKRRLEENQASEYHRNFEKKLDQCEGLTFDTPEIAYNQTTVVARLWFHEMVRAALSLTPWWEKQLAKDEKPEEHPTELLKDPEKRADLERDLLKALREPSYDAQRGRATINLAWLARVAGTIALAADPTHHRDPEQTSWEKLEARSRDARALVRAVLELLDVPEPDETLNPDLFSINRNRPSMISMYRSVPTVKADAVQQLFDVKGFNINWAILDSGIDATHWAFRKRNAAGDPETPAFEPTKSKRGNVRWENHTRVLKTYDFTRIRSLMSDDPGAKWKSGLSDEAREELKRSLKTGRMIDWELLEPALRIEHDGDYEKHIPELSHHGTHVAGILGADWRSTDDPEDVLPFSEERDERPQSRTGVCPEIGLYDLRVVDDVSGEGNEFSIMAALQFVRSLNARRDYVAVHGVNLSLSLTHEVSNYACGQTPVCNECERLVGAGIVVVASAGNRGRRRFLTRKGDEEAYASISITDPGNADAVITVGATHSRDPHTYGVSYFSSRGPTGDGRLKPDLVAPGEKVCSTIPYDREEYLDGTSMAAPHVSGAAALLMCRHRELIGSPLRIKKILCDAATDLGREPYFQGAGLLDILRAMQSI